MNQREGGRVAELGKTRKKTDGSKAKGIKSAGVGAAVLTALSASRTPLHLRDVARAAGMASSNAYRYLVSFSQAGFVRQNDDGRYDLGPAAIELGLAALSRIDGLTIADRSLTDLTESTGLDGHVSVFGTAGSTVVRWHGRPKEIALRVNEGTILPLLTSATGRLFAVHMPQSRVEPLLAEELDRLSAERQLRPKQLREQFEQERATILKTGISIASQERRRGIDAIAAPILDRSRHIAFSITLIGMSGSFDMSLEGVPARHLRAACQAASRLLGYKAD